MQKLAFMVLLLALGRMSLGDDSERLLSIDHYVRVRSTVPAIAGQDVPIYVRERVQAGTALRSASNTDRVALFVHGAGTPAEVAFDVPQPDYSWMAYLARAGFDVFAMDTTGYGRSNRPPAMNDACNLARDRQSVFVPSLIPAPCAPSYPPQLTTIASDWNDIGAVVDYVRALRHVERVRDLFTDLGAPQKLFVDLACSSHNAMWEKNRLLLLGASLEWLTGGSVNGMKEGTLRLGY